MQLIHHTESLKLQHQLLKAINALKDPTKYVVHCQQRGDEFQIGFATEKLFHHTTYDFKQVVMRKIVFTYTLTEPEFEAEWSYPITNTLTHIVDYANVYLESVKRDYTEKHSK